MDENPCLEEQLVRGQVTVPNIEVELRAGEVRNCQVGSQSMRCRHLGGQENEDEDKHYTRVRNKILKKKT